MNEARTNGGSSRAKALFVLLAIGLIAVAIVYGRSFFGGVSISSLAYTALTADSPAEQVRAAQGLSQLGEPALEAMRSVTSKSTNPDVVAVCIWVCPESATTSQWIPSSRSWMINLSMFGPRRHRH